MGNGVQQSSTLPPAAAVLQFDVQSDWQDNVQRVKRLTKGLSPPEGTLVVLPELWATGFDYAQLDSSARTTPALLAELQQLAEQYQSIFAGSLVEGERQSGGTAHFYNTLFFTGAAGVCGQYRKQHLFSPMDEDQYFSAGENPLPVQTPLGVIGGLVCYDLRFPDLARSQVGGGARLLVVSAQWPTARREQWRVLLRARAIENQAYVVACNRCGTTGQTEFGGYSAIVGPDGALLFEAGAEESCGIAALDPIRVAELRNSFNTVGPTPHRFAEASKVADLATAVQRVVTAQGVGKKIVFTNGCFDILHQGHVTYLEQARKQGDFLVLGLNSDASIRAIKGPSRPVNPEPSRARVLAALACVDLIVPFSDETPLALITALRPNVLVKGADWPVEKIVGSKEVLANGGAVINIPMVENVSTTGLIETIQRKKIEP